MSSVDVDCTVVDLAAVRVALTAALEAETFDGAPLRVNPWLADMWAPPCALIGTFAVVWEDSSFLGRPTATVQVRLVVNAQALRPAQLDLDALVVAYARALYADRHLGGVVADCRPVRTQSVLMLRGSAELPAVDCETLVIF